MSHAIQIHCVSEELKTKQNWLHSYLVHTRFYSRKENTDIFT
jgi:hypothetical protein